MESFVFSASLAFVVYEALAFARPPEQKLYNFSIGQITIAFGKTAAVWARRIVLALMVFGVLFFLLVIHEVIFPFDLISRNRVNITLGLFSGPIFGIWLNSIIRHPPDTGLSKGQIVGGIGLVLLFIVGSIGNEAGKFIERYARRINSLKVAGTELSFAERSRHGATPGSPSTAPAGAYGGGGFVPSQGLQYAANLNAWFVQRDVGYLKLFGALDQSITDKFAGTKRLATDVIEPPLSCLSGWLQTKPDAVSVDQHLRAFAGTFGYLNALDNAAVRKRFTDDYVRRWRALVSDIELFDDVKSGPCKRLIELSSAPDWNISPALDAVVANRDSKERPYLAIVHASLMAQLGQYPAATTILTNWLAAQQRTAAGAGIWPTTADWLDLRARSILAAYMEEWVQSNEAGVATPLRDEHLKNLDALRQGLKRVLTTNKFFSGLLQNQWQKDRDAFVRPGACSFHDPDADTWRRLFTSYVSMALTYQQNVLLHPAYDAVFAEDSSGDLKTLAQLDLSCVVDRSELLYAQMMEVYTRNAILYSDVRGESEREDSKKSRIDAALLAAIIGLEYATKAAKADQPSPDKPFSDRIAPSEALATKEALANNLRRLKALREE
jgi:hypothetical protein